MADERGFRVRLQDSFERSRVPGAPGAFVLEVVHFLEVHQDGHAKIGGERVHPPQLGAVGGDVELHFPESLGSVLHRLRQGRFCFGLRDVCAVEPREPPGAAASSALT